jgi:hypothetical protein
MFYGDSSNAMPPADSGRWVTPPPLDDGSSVWSGEEFASVIDSQYLRDPSYLDRPSDTSYASTASFMYSSAYPYYSGAARVGQSLPPYWPQPANQIVAVDGWAITSLIFGILGGWILGLGFGIAALQRIAAGRRRGRGLALAGVSLSVAWIVVDAVIAVALR